MFGHQGTGFVTLFRENPAQSRFTHIPVYVRAMFRPGGDHISSIHRSRLYGICATRTVISTLYTVPSWRLIYPSLGSSFKAPRKQAMTFDGIPAAKCLRDHSRTRRLKEKNYFLPPPPPPPPRPSFNSETRFVDSG